MTSEALQTAESRLASTEAALDVTRREAEARASTIRWLETQVGMHTHTHTHAGRWTHARLLFGGWKHMHTHAHTQRQSISVVLSRATSERVTYANGRSNAIVEQIVGHEACACVCVCVCR